MERTLAGICEHVHGELIGDGATIIRGVNAFDLVGQGELTFADSSQRLAQAMASPAAAIIVPQEIKDLQGRSGIRVPNPKLAFARLLDLFHPEAPSVEGIHSTAVLGRHVELGERVSIQACAVIGDDVSIGPGTTIAAGVSIGRGVTIGGGCQIDPRVVLYRHTRIGDRVLIHAGAVIGGDGFGYVMHEGAHIKVPQVGNVVIEDDVEIGCNVCIDRATVGSTIIRQGTKIDNLVQIAHNDRIGRHVLMAGQVGLSGSVQIGDYAVLAGKTGVTDHLTIGARVQIGAASVVTKSVPDGQTVWGYPARPLQHAKRQMASVARLPEMVRRLTRLIARVQEHDARLADLERRPKGPTTRP